MKKKTKEKKKTKPSAFLKVPSFFFPTPTPSFAFPVQFFSTLSIPKRDEILPSLFLFVKCAMIAPPPQARSSPPRLRVQRAFFPPPHLLSPSLT